MYFNIYIPIEILGTIDVYKQTVKYCYTTGYNYKSSRTSCKSAILANITKCTVYK